MDKKNIKILIIGGVILIIILSIMFGYSYIKTAQMRLEVQVEEKNRQRELDIRADCFDDAEEQAFLENNSWSSLTHSFNVNTDFEAQERERDAAFEKYYERCLSKNGLE